MAEEDQKQLDSTRLRFAITTLKMLVNQSIQFHPVGHAEYSATLPLLPVR